MSIPRISSASIRAARPQKEVLDSQRPYAFLCEPEHGADGRIVDVATLFLTNRECPFECLMCDLWKHTLDTVVPAGAIPAQIDWAITQLPSDRTIESIKLYNSGNFFDPRAIPPDDYTAIARRLHRFRTVIVENHPRLCTDRCLAFRDLLAPGTEFEIALGLETIHPEVLPALNKQMTTDDFANATRFLAEHGIYTRTFILLRPPFLSEAAGLDWALRSLRFAFDCGVRVAAIIPTRGGNGMLERLAEQQQFAPPTLSSLESALDEGLAMKRGRVFVDLWDVGKLTTCSHCGTARAERLHQMNLSQQILPRIVCLECNS